MPYAEERREARDVEPGSIIRLSPGRVGTVERVTSCGCGCSLTEIVTSPGHGRVLCPSDHPVLVVAPPV